MGISVNKFMSKSQTNSKEKKNIILLIGAVGYASSDNIIQLGQIQGIKDLKKVTNTSYRVGALIDKKDNISAKMKKKIDVIIQTNTKSVKQLEEALAPYQDQIAAVLCRWEETIPLYARIIPLLSYITHPTLESLDKTSDKIEMRKILKKHTPDLSPNFSVVLHNTKKIRKDIEKNIKFPCVIKPASLASSKLVSVCYYPEELKGTLADTFRKIRSVYKNSNVEREPQILVEQLMEGQLYSIDAHVNAKGRIYYTPAIEVKTGRDMGFDDFFLYSQMCPSNLDTKEVEELHEVCNKVIYAFGLRAVSAHIEIYKTKQGFKIVEIGPRVGGYRDELLGMAFGIKHYVNDYLNHLNIAPKLKKTKRKHSVLLKFWPKETGILKSVKGFQKIKEEKFVVESDQSKQPGDKINPAKYGAPPTVKLYLVAESRAKLLGYIRRVEKTIDIIIE